MTVVGIDAPLDARALERLAARALFGLARTGSSYSNGSGDFAIAFSTAPTMRTRHGEAAPVARTALPPEALSPLFQAALEATEQAVYNARSGPPPSPATAGPWRPFPSIACGRSWRSTGPCLEGRAWSKG